MDAKVTRRNFLKAGAAAAAWAAGAGRAVAQAATSEYDLIIKGGLVLDGEKDEPSPADVAVKGDRIAAVGRIDQPAGLVLDASGLLVAPGFIDVHTHCDLTFKRTGLQRLAANFMPSWKGNHNYLRQGVTTVVTGNCGYGYTNADLWSVMLKSLGFGTNVLHLAPHGMMRQKLFGQEQPQALSRKQLEAFKARLSEELDKGVAGLSAGLAYAPGLLAQTTELIELSRLVARRGGLFTVHMRDETGADRDGIPAVIRSINEAVEICRRAEVPVQISHLKIFAPRGDCRADQVLELIASARDEGLPIMADQYPYEAGSTQISFLLPDRFKTAVGVKDRFKTKAGRTELMQAVKGVFAFLPPEKILITMYPGFEEYEGRNVGEISEMKAVPPAEAFVEMVVEDPAPMGVFFGMDPDQVLALMRADFVITASDGWTVPYQMTQPHPRTYGTFPRKFRTALDRKILPLDRIIKSMTSMPADQFGLKDRGRIAVGLKADLTVFDPDNLTDRADYRNPHQYSEGVVHLLVNGRPAIVSGNLTGSRSGRVLKRT